MKQSKNPNPFALSQANGFGFYFDLNTFVPVSFTRSVIDDDIPVPSPSSEQLEEDGLYHAARRRQQQDDTE